MSKKDEDAGGVLVFGQHLDKSTVLQEARVFNESPVNARKCRLVLTKIICLLNVGESFTTREATELFFSVTKLFQAKDNGLRQMVYVTIKELAAIAEDVIMVTSSLTKDMQPRSDVLCRANAIRTLRKITDASMMQGIERFLKASIIDSNQAVASAALVSSYHLSNVSRDVVRRWVNETQEAATKMSPGFHSIVQYHAIGLLFVIRQHDRMALNKLVQSFVDTSRSMGAGWYIKSDFAHCLLIRYACKVVEDDADLRQTTYDLLAGWLKNHGDLVAYEAARAICSMGDLTADEVEEAVTILQGFLLSTQVTLRFGAIRTLNALAKTRPAVVAKCNRDIESLIADSNRSVSTFAIITLLTTGDEDSVDRLMEQVSSFMSEFPDEFKVIVIDAVRALCRKFPAKQAVMLAFLSGVLRDEGGLDCKEAAVEALIDLLQNIPQCKETALPHLCEYIEDCEYTKLSIRILHLLGKEGPMSKAPKKLIRFIHNRLILENSVVRAAAVSALTQFGLHAAHDDPLYKSIKVILRRCTNDNDDEVRDRAVLYLAVLEANDPIITSVVNLETTYVLPILERALLDYVAQPSAQEQLLDITSVPMISRNEEAAEQMRVVIAELPGSAASSTSKTAGFAGADAGTTGTAVHLPTAVERQRLYASQLEKIPEFASYGPLFASSSKPVELTESGTEYTLSCVKHTFSHHVVFQFNIMNTIPDSQLEDVTVVMVPEDTENGLCAEIIIPAEKLAFDVPGVTYVSYLKTDPTVIITSAVFSCTLKFVVKDCDPATGKPDEDGYEDEYLLDDVSLTTADHIAPAYIADFKLAWNGLPPESEIVETFELTSLKSIADATLAIIDLLGMHALENTGNPTSQSAHQLLLAGTFVTGPRVLVRARMTFVATAGVTLELAVRSDRTEISQMVVEAIE